MNKKIQLMMVTVLLALTNCQAALQTDKSETRSGKKLIDFSLLVQKHKNKPTSSLWIQLVPGEEFFWPGTDTQDKEPLKFPAETVFFQIPGEEKTICLATFMKSLTLCNLHLLSKEQKSAIIHLFFRGEPTFDSFSFEQVYGVTLPDKSRRLVLTAQQP